MGIPIEEARTYLESTRENDKYDADITKRIAAECIAESMAALIREANNPAGRIKSEGGVVGAAYVYHDVDAAKALMQAGLKLKLLAGQQAAKAPASPDDLFDAAEGNWSFPEHK